MDEWDEKYEKAASAIVFRITDEFIAQFYEGMTAKELWDKIHRTLEPTGTAAILEHATALFKTDAVDSSDIEEHLRVLEEHKCALDCHSKALSDSRYSFIIIASLPQTESWNSFCAAITASGLPPSPDTIINRVLSHYRDSRKGVEQQMAVAACLGPPSHSSGSNQSGCHRKRKHMHRNRDSQDIPNNTCRNCGRTGHWKGDCRSEGRGKYKPPCSSGTQNEQVRQAEEEDSYSGNDQSSGSGE